MLKIKNFFHNGWSHGRYFDYWSFIHFLTGVILGIGATIISADYFLSFIIIFILLGVYEGIEMLVRVSEGFENILLDIVIGSMGSAIAIFLLPEILSKQNIFGVLSLCILVNLAFVSSGWKNFLKRKAQNSASSYKYILYALYFIYVSGILVTIVSSFYWFNSFTLI